MKKFLSMIIVVALILGTFSITGVYANTTGIDSSLIFDLDFSEYDSASTGAKGLKNAVTDNSTEFAKVSISSTGTIRGTGTKYVEMDRGTSGIKIKDETLNSSETVTIETWTYVDGTNPESAHMFLYSKDDGTKDGARLQVLASGNTAGFEEGTKVWLYALNTSDNNIGYTQTVDEWVHMVYVREKTDNGVFYAVYENGKEKISGTNKELTLDMTGYDEAYMNIGGGTYQANGNSGTSYKGRFAMVKIYNGAMTQAEAEAKWDATKDSYVDNYDIDNDLIFDLDLSGYDSASTSAAKGLKNAVTDTDADFAKVSVDSVGTIRGTGKKYVHMNGGSNGIMIKNDDLNKAKTVTIETWTYADSTNITSAHMFLHSLDDANSSSGPRIQIYQINNDTWNYTYAGTAVTPPTYTQTRGKWVHMVFVREQTADGVSYAVYEDGQKKMEATKAGLTLDMSTFANAYMNIGGGTYKNGGASTGYKGKFATVKIYDIAMTRAEAEAKYKATKDDYVDNYDLNSDLIFDLDFSEYDSTSTAAAKGLKNAVTNTDADFARVNIGSTGAIPGTTTNYVQMNGGSNGIMIKNDDLNKAETVTIETWTCADSTNITSAHMFLHSLDDTNSSNGPRIQIYGSAASGTWYYTYAGAASGMPTYAQTLDKWVHMVFVREKTDNGVSYAVYENGKKKIVATSSVTLDMSSFANAYMNIGGGTYKNGSAGVGYKGKFATVKIYDIAMTQAEAAASYEATKKNFEAADTAANTVIFKNQNSFVIDSLNSATKTVTAEFTFENTTDKAVTPAVLLAFYDDGVLKNVNVADTTEVAVNGTLPVTVSVDGIAPDEKSEVKLFVWDSLNNCNPLLNMFHLQSL